MPAILVAPLTSGSRPAPFRVATMFDGKTGLMLLEQVRAVDARRLVRKVGQLDRMTLGATIGVLRALFSE